MSLYISVSAALEPLNAIHSSQQDLTLADTRGCIAHNAHLTRHFDDSQICPHFHN